jgi:hypothetical protein
MPTLAESVERWVAEVGPDALAAARARAAAAEAERWRWRETFDLCRELNDPRPRPMGFAAALVSAGRYVEAAAADPTRREQYLAMERASHEVEERAHRRSMERLSAPVEAEGWVAAPATFRESALSDDRLTAYTF